MKTPTTPKPKPDVAREQALRANLALLADKSFQLSQGTVIGGVKRMAMAADINKLAGLVEADFEIVLSLPKSGETSARLARAAARLLADPSDATPNEIRSLAGCVLAQVPDHLKPKK